MSTEFQIVRAIINYSKSKDFYYKEVQIDILKNLVNMLDTDLKLAKNKKLRDEIESNKQED